LGRWHEVSTSRRPIRLVLVLGMVTAVSILTFCRYTGTSASQQDVEALFTQAYREWIDYRSSLKTMRSDVDPMVAFDHNSFRRIIALGVPVLPYAVAQVQEDHVLGYAIYKISKARLHVRRSATRPREYVWTVDEFPDIRETHGPPDSRLLWKRWWTEYRPTVRARFEELHREWRLARSEGKSADAERLYAAMHDLGVLALPAILATISTGERDLAPLVSELTDGALKTDVTAEQAVAWWAKNKARWTLPEQQSPAPAPETKEETAPAAQ